MEMYRKKYLHFKNRFAKNNYQNYFLKLIPDSRNQFVFTLEFLLNEHILSVVAFPAHNHETSRFHCSEPRSLFNYAVLMKPVTAKLTGAGPNVLYTEQL